MTRSALLAWIALIALPGCGPARVPEQPSAAAGQAATERKAEALERNAAAGGNAAGVSASEAILIPEAQAVDPQGTQDLDDAITCLARTIYWEARGEPATSMEAVASVVMNRLAHEGFPNTVCAVVRQGNEGGACQFSWWCDGRPDQASEDAAYAGAKEISRRALNLQLADRTAGALYFHHRDVTPGWSAEYTRTVEIGEFAFYKPRGGDAR